MKIGRVIIFLFLVIGLTLQSCAKPQPTQAGLPLQDQASTAVAGTLAAVTEIPTVTNTLAPTSTATLTPTPPPGILKVVYSRAGAIWIWTEGGEPRALTDNIVDAKPRLSADGEIVVFERNNELFAVNADGTNLHVLVSDEYLKNYLPGGYKFIWAEYYDWMLNTHYLYFSTRSGISGPDTDVNQYDLHRVNVDTGEISRIVPPGQGGIPYFSLDGTTIAMMQSGAIYLANVNGTEAWKVLTFGPIPRFMAPPLDAYIHLPYMVSLPNGSGFRARLPYTENGKMYGQLEKILEIPNVGEPILVTSYKQYEGPPPPKSPTILSYLWTLPLNGLSLDGTDLGYTIADANSVLQTCIENLDINQKNCTTQSSSKMTGFLNWSPDNKKFITYSFQDIKHSLSFFISEDLNSFTPLITNYWMLWVGQDSFIYLDTSADLYLASLDGSQTKIYGGITKQYFDADQWQWQFDFSH